MADFRTEATDRLFQTFLNLESLDNCYKYFDDLCTKKEIIDMAQRLEAAIMLEKGANYLTISKQVGISTATIGRVSNCLRYGSGGYESAIRKLEESEKK